MSESYIQNLFAERIGGVDYGKDTAIYKFEKIKRAKNAVLEANPGAEIIDMGVGEPDEMAFPEVVAKLHEEHKNRPTAVTPITAAKRSRKPPPGSSTMSAASAA